MEHPIYTVGLGGNPEFAQPTLRFGYTTMATPSAVSTQFDLRSRRADAAQGDPGARRLRPRAATSSTASGPRPPTAPRCRSRSWCPRAAPRDGSTPFLLYGYGSYETSIDPYFTISRLSLLDRGMGFAIAHVRGGGEMGRRWYDDGKLLNKRNTFTDFVACARHLADDRLDLRGPAGRRGRQRRRPAHGRGREPGARGVRRDRRRRAVRRPADHDPRPVAAADGHRVGGVGQPAATTPRSTPT